MSDQNTVTVTVTAIDQASKTLQAVGMAFNTITGSLKDVAKAYIDYGSQVQKIALFTGVSNEQTSRLIQLADDAFVSADTLQLAMKNMADKGLQPSAENMAKLSDQFIKIQDPAKQSKFLIDEFGRSGMDMAKVMTLGGEKILAMNKNIEAGLVIDDQKQAAIQRSKQELDAFNDSMDAMKYQTADALLQVFNAMPEPLRNAGLMLNQFLSPTNINSLIQFGILLKGINIAETFTAIKGAIETARIAWVVYTPAAWSAATATLAAVAPFVALGAAIAFLAKVIIDNWAELQKAAAILSYGVTGQMPDWAKNIKEPTTPGLLNVDQYFTPKAGGGSVRGGGAYLVGERGPEIFTPNGSGSIIPNNAIGGNVVIQLSYSPVVSMANRYEAETILAPYIQSALRKVQGYSG